MEEFAKWLKDSLESVPDFFESLVLTLQDMLKDLFYWMVEIVVTSAVGFFNQITDGASWDLSQYITALPNVVTQFMGAIGIGNCMAVITTALMIRFLMGLVPFIRLGG